MHQATDVCQNIYLLCVNYLMYFSIFTFFSIKIGLQTAFAYFVNRYYLPCSLLYDDINYILY